MDLDPASTGKLHGGRELGAARESTVARGQGGSCMAACLPHEHMAVLYRYDRYLTHMHGGVRVCSERYMHYPRHACHQAIWQRMRRV